MLDSFEWRAGYTAKFGFHYVDFNSKYKTRTPKLSAKVFSKIVMINRIDYSYTPKLPKEDENKKIFSISKDNFVSSFSILCLMATVIVYCTIKLCSRKKKYDDNDNNKEVAL